jgi:hypothetical protein
LQRIARRVVSLHFACINLISTFAINVRWERIMPWRPVENL